MAELRVQKTRVEITASGKKKLKAIEAAVNGATERALRDGAREYKQVLAAAMPDDEEEAQLLSQGSALAFTRSKTGRHQWRQRSRVGTPDGGRFLKIGGMLPLREAILVSSVTVTKTGPRTMTMTTARDAEINARSGFFWETANRGVQGPTLPFNRNLMQAMNDGGVWEVQPRTTRLLNPEDGVVTPLMIKTLQPRRGRQVAQAEVVPKIHASIERRVKRALKQIRA